MRKFKVFFAILLCASMLTSSLIPVSAATTSDVVTLSDQTTAFARGGAVYQTLNMLCQDPASFGLDVDDLLNATIGEGFTIAQHNENDITANNDIMYYPIVSDGTVIAIITLIKNQGKISCTIGIDYAPMLNDMLTASNGADLVMYSTDNGIYSVTENNVSTTVFLDTTLSTETSATSATSVNDVMFTSVQGKASVISADTITAVKYHVNNMLDKTRDATDYLYFLENFPTVQQESNNCWAACVASVLRYEFPSQYANYMGGDVCSDMGISGGAYFSEILDALNYYFSSPYVPSTLNRSAVLTEMSNYFTNNDPAIMWCESDESASAHTLTWCGYGHNGTEFFVRYMNPGYGSLGIAYTTGGSYSFTYNGYDWYWTQTLYFAYA